MEHVLWGVLVFLVSFVASLLMVVAVVVKLPANYFLDRPERRLWVDRHPAVRVTLIALKNLLGLGLIAAGILLSVPGIPGQGILTMFIGLLLLDFPGKRRWERRLVGQPRILTSINRLRGRFGKKPMQLGERD